MTKSFNLFSIDCKAHFTYEADIVEYSFHLIDYKDDLSMVRQAVTTVLENNTRVLTSPAWIVAVETLGRDGVHLVVQPWVKVDDYADVKFEVTEAIKNEFDKYNITIATSPIDLHRLG